MLSNLFLSLSLVGAEWVLYLLLLLSVLSIALVIERARYYAGASRGLAEFRAIVREATAKGELDRALKAAADRAGKSDLETAVAHAMLLHARDAQPASAEVLAEIAQDAVLRAKLGWERNLAYLATIGSNAPFIGLFGTVLGIIEAFHSLSLQAGGGAQTVTAGISEALVATAVGILVAIPAVVAFNLFQRRVRSAVTEAEALKSFLIGKLSQAERHH